MNTKIHRPVSRDAERLFWVCRSLPKRLLISPRRTRLSPGSPELLKKRLPAWGGGEYPTKTLRSRVIFENLFRSGIHENPRPLSSGIPGIPVVLSSDSMSRSSPSRAGNSIGLDLQPPPPPLFAANQPISHPFRYFPTINASASGQFAALSRFGSHSSFRPIR